MPVLPELSALATRYKPHIEFFFQVYASAKLHVKGEVISFEQFFRFLCRVRCPYFPCRIVFLMCCSDCFYIGRTWAGRWYPRESSCRYAATLPFALACA